VHIAVLGSTGGTGVELIVQALERGYGVTALARRPAALPMRHPRLQVVPGDVLAAGDVANAVRGADAVLSALGIGYSRAATTVYSQGTANALDAMRDNGVRRLLVVSTSSLHLPSRRHLAEWLLARCLLHPLLKRPYADIARMEERIARSTCNWTVLRAARLTNGRRTGRYRTAVNARLPGCWSISRADLAACMIEHITAVDTYRATVDVAY
jgi:putative NADH-flavin reductase